MTGIVVTVEIDSSLEALVRKLSGPELPKFMATQTDALVSQVRANLTRKGALASSDWPRLSRPYAKRKAAGKTPGNGKFKQSMLKDTGLLNDSLVARVEDGPRGPRMVLDAVGSRRVGKRTLTNSRLLLIHANGEGTMPRRNPADPRDMGLYLKRLERALRVWLDKAA